MARHSRAELTAHVLRRLSLGGHPALVDDLDPTTAIDRALDLSDPPKELPDLDPPPDFASAREPEQIIEAIAWWVDAALDRTRLVEERLAWFWHDHFATSLAKVPIPYVLWQQHKTIRRHATGNFRDLLMAVATDPAMLAYLDGLQNTVEAPNENFAREVMELHTMGPGNYTQSDITEAARAFTGWVVRVPGSRLDRVISDVQPWQSTFVPGRHDPGTKTILGVTAEHDLESALAAMLDQPATRPFVAAKLFSALVGLDPEPPTLGRLTAAFDSYEIMDLVWAIVTDPAFLSDRAVRTRIRSPFERLITVGQAFGFARPTRTIVPMLVAQQFVPFAPPNPAGYPDGAELLGPHALVHGFDLAGAVDRRNLVAFDRTGTSYLHRLGVRDAEPSTLAAIAAAADEAHQLALSINAPEMILS